MTTTNSAESNNGAGEQTTILPAARVLEHLGDMAYQKFDALAEAAGQERDDELGPRLSPAQRVVRSMRIVASEIYEQAAFRLWNFSDGMYPEPDDNDGAND